MRMLYLHIMFLFCTLALMVWGLLSGSYELSWHEIFEPSSQTYTIFWQIRLPRVLTALASGGGLAIVGLLLQTLFRNPLADASVLGITQGASLGVAVILLGFYKKSFITYDISPFGGFLVIPAVLGAWSVMAFLVLLAIRFYNLVYLLITGLMTGSLATAIIALWQYSSKPEQLQSFLLWSLGNLSGTNLYSALLLIGIISFGIVLSVWEHTSLDKLALGDVYAQHLGVNLKILRIKIILICGLIVGSITAFCGPIGFVGLTVPFMVRSLLKTSLFLPTAIGSALVGSSTLLLADNLLKTMAQAGYFYPLNAFLTLIGAPIVIQILYKQKV